MEWLLYHLLKQWGPSHNDNQVSSCCHGHTWAFKWEQRVNLIILRAHINLWQSLLQGPGGQNHPLDEGQGCQRGVCIPTWFIPGPCGKENGQLAQGVKRQILGKGFVALQFTWLLFLVANWRQGMWEASQLCNGPLGGHQKVRKATRNRRGHVCGFQVRQACERPPYVSRRRHLVEHLYVQ